MVAYDAFVSYSHAKDKPIAAALQSVVQKLGNPWYRRRALRVFRDDTSLSATPSLWPSIEHALGQSRFLIMLTSPEAATSPWVNKEVAFWLEHKSVDTLLIGMTDGELAWDSAASDFGWREGIPLLPVLNGRFTYEPKWVDLRAYRDGADQRDARFIEHAANFAATIRGIPKEDLLSQEVRQQRRALKLAWSAAASLSLVTGTAAWQWNAAINAERVAVAEAARAERNFGAAKETIDSVIFDLAQGLQNVEGMRADTVRRILGRAEIAIGKLASRTENDPIVRSSQAAMFGLFSSTFSKLGDSRLAADYSQRALDLARELSVADPGNLRWRHNVSAALESVGYTLRAQGDLSGSLAAYREGLDIAREIAAKESGNTQWKHGISIALGSVGYTLRAQGDLSGALAAYREGLDIAREIAAKEPDNTALRSGVSVSLILIGGVLMAQRDVAGALAAYRESSEIMRKLSAEDASNTAWRRQASASLSGLGGALRAQGDLAGALAAYREGLDIIRALAAKDTDNTVWRGEMSVSLSNVGGVLVAQGDLNGALAAYREGLDIGRELSAKALDKNGWLLGLVVDLNKVGDILKAKGDLAGMITAYQERLGIVRALAAQDNILRQSDVVMSLDYLALAGDDPRGRWSEALAILVRLKLQGQLSPAQQEWVGAIAANLLKLPQVEDGRNTAVEQIQGTYDGAIAVSGAPGERPISLTFQQSGRDVTATIRGPQGELGRGAGTIKGNVIGTMPLQIDAPTCPGTFAASLMFTGDNVVWTYSGQDCRGPVQGHGLATKTRF